MKDYTNNIRILRDKLLRLNLKKQRKSQSYYGVENDIVWHMAMALGYGPEEVIGKSIYEFIEDKTKLSSKEISHIANLKDPKKMCQYLEQNYLWNRL